MAFSFLQRGSVSEYARQLSLTSYEPSLALEGLVAGIDNLRHDVFLSPRFTAAAQRHIFKMIARHGNVEELAVEQTPTAAIGSHMPARIRDRHVVSARPFDPSELKKLTGELHLAVLKQAKIQNSIALDLLFRLAVLKFERAELASQYCNVLERCRARMKMYDGPRHVASHSALEARDRFASFQVNKRAVLRRAGQELFAMLRDVERETLGKTRRSLFGENESYIYDMLLNRLLFVDDAEDSFLTAEHYVLLGASEHDPDRLEAVDAIIGRFFQTLGLVESPDDIRVQGLLNAPENAQELMALGAPDHSTAQGKGQKAVLGAWLELLEKEGVMERVLAAYEAARLLGQYSPPINPQQLKKALISGEEHRRVEALLEEHGRISAENLHEAAHRVKTTRPAEKAKLAGRFFSDFLRYHRDLRRLGVVMAAMETVNVLSGEKARELSAVNRTLYEFLLPEEQKPVEDKVVHHVVLKADIRESTTLTRTLLERGLNPASYFSLNFYDPINKLLPKYDARKVFIEGDAIILALFEREGDAGVGVAQTCVLAKEIVEVVTAYNERSRAAGLPSLELGIGISYQDSAPMYLMDGTRPIMISKAINESDRLSSCSKGIRQFLGKRDLLFNVFSFKTIDDADAGANADEFLLRYNIGGIHISRAAFEKLRTEISLQAFDLKVPLLWKNGTTRVYTGMAPLGQGLFHRIVVREGRIAHIDRRDFTLKQYTDQPYYEVCTHARIYEAIESFQNAAAAAAR
jgi:class 3 adenylate cyclase